MKVLLSAYACLPGLGSEPAVGWETLRAAARCHDVWLLTQPPMARAVTRALQGSPLAERVTVVPVEPPAAPRGRGLAGLLREQWRHDRWQRRAARVAVALDRAVDVDVVHHVTLAAYWMRTGVAAVPKPLVWGPVGGGVQPPLGLLAQTGVRGVAEDALRAVVRAAGGATARRRTAPRAAVTLVQNAATARLLRGVGEVRVLCNALAVPLPAVAPSGPRRRDVVVVGRLIGWKGVRLAVRAFRHVSHPDAVLRLFGEGPEHAAVLRAARRWGVADRVVVEGTVPRARLLDEVARAGALLHPALHEEGGMAVAEALALRTPVVCLRHGGPAALVEQWPDSPARLVVPTRPEETARALAAALDDVLADPGPVADAPVPPKTSYADAVLDAYERATAG